MILQSDLVSETRTVVAAPFVPDVPFLPRLNPPMVVAGHKLALKVTDLATMPSALHNPVDNLGAERDRIVAAPDLLFTGI